MSVSTAHCAMPSACAPYAAAIEQMIGTRPSGPSSVLGSATEGVNARGTRTFSTTMSWLPEALHESALARIDLFFGWVATSDEILAALPSGSIGR